MVPLQKLVMNHIVYQFLLEIYEGPVTGQKIAPHCSLTHPENKIHNLDKMLETFNDLYLVGGICWKKVSTNEIIGKSE